MTVRLRSDTLAILANGKAQMMAEATILQFPRRKMRANMRTMAGNGNDRLLDLACLSMSLAEDARHRPRDGGVNADGEALTTAFLCAGIILGAIDRDEFTLDE